MSRKQPKIESKNYGVYDSVFMVQGICAKWLGVTLKWYDVLVSVSGDILLLAHSVNALQNILHVCEKELDWLDLTINVTKSSCMRIGPPFKVRCKNVVS